MKKIISLLLVAMLALSSAIAVNAEGIRDVFSTKAESVSARGAVMYSGTWDNLTWEISDDYVLTISGTGDMSEFTGYAPWYDYRAYVRSVKVSSGVTSIASRAFKEMYNLEQVELPDTLTTIGSSAFYDCGYLTHITIPDSVTSIGDYAFGECESLKSITLSNSLERLNYYVFYYCSSLKTLVVPESVTYIDDAFYRCTNLDSIEILGADTEIKSLPSYTIIYGPADSKAYDYCVNTDTTSRFRSQGTTYDITLNELNITVTKTVGEPLDLPIPEKSGYVFVGWAEGYQYMSELEIYDRLNRETSSTVFNPKWIQLYDYGTLSEASGSATVEADGSLTVPLPTAIEPPVNSNLGDYFICWTNYNRTERVAYDSINLKYAPTSLRAEWLNLDTSTGTVVENPNKPERNDLDDPIPLPILTRDDYRVFAGWAKQQNASPSEVLTYNLLNTEDLPELGGAQTNSSWGVLYKNLYPSWIELNTLTGYLTSEGADDFASSNIRGYYDDAIVMPIPAKENAVFTGWTNTLNVDSGSTWSYDLLKIEDASSVMYANYLDLDPNGGVLDETKPVEITHNDDGSVDISLPIPTRDGYAFAGWAKSTGAMEYTYGDTVAFDSINSTDLPALRAAGLLEAVWIKLYVPVFHENTETNQWLDYNYSATVEEMKPLPGWIDHHFVAWTDSTNPSEANVAVYNHLDKTAATENIEGLFSIWFDLDPNGGTLPEGEIDFGARDLDDTIVLPTPVKAGSVFDGWYNGDEKVEDITIGELTHPYSLLRARWVDDEEENPEGTSYIRYYDGSKLLQESVINDGETTHKLTETPIASAAEGLPVKDGYLFGGWYTTDLTLGTTNGTAFPQNITIADYDDANGNLNLYAAWVPVGTVNKDGNDKNSYGGSSLKGFSLEGVQIRSKEVADKYQPGMSNTDQDALRFVTVYRNGMLEELQSLNGKSVSYGYTAYAKSDIANLTKLDKSTVGAVDVDCTKEGDQNHRMFGDYRLSTLVIKYDGADSAYKGERVEARAYVDYTDANGFGRRGYHTYSDSKFAGGCRTSFNGAYNAVNAAYDALAKVA